MRNGFYLLLTAPSPLRRWLTAWAVVLLLLLLAVPLPGWAQTPTISNFTPGSGSAGTSVTITGTNLNRVRGVRFGGGALALFTAQSATSLTVKVPVDAASGPIRLTPVTGNAVSSTGSFQCLVRPRGMLTTLSPAGPLDVCQARTLTASAATPAFPMTRGGISGSVYSVVMQPDGKILVGGVFDSWQFFTYSTYQYNLTRINPDGSLDTGFSVGTGFNSTVNSIALQADGKILVGGRFSTYNGTSASRLIRLNADGSVDGSFVTGSGFSFSFGRPYYVQTVVVQPDGKILVGGVFDSYNGQSKSAVVRLNADGSLDTTFNQQIYSVFGVNAIALQDDGKVLLGGDFKAYNNDLTKGRFIRVNADGSLDAAFTPSGGNFNIYSNGTNPNGAYINSIAVQADGKILAGGYFSSYNGTNRDNLARILPTGLLDATFAPGSLSEVAMVAGLRDGHVLVGRAAGGNGESGFLRLNSDGSGAGTNSYSATRAGTNGAVVYAVAEQPDGKLLIGGRYDSYSNRATNGTSTGHNSLVRVNADFSPNNAPTTIYGAAYTFSPGSTTANPLTTSAAGGYSVVASLNGETSPASNTVTLTACPTPNNITYNGGSGTEGSSVTITGNYLDQIQNVRFGTGGRGLFTAQSMYSLTVQVPIDAATGPLTLTTATGFTYVTPNTFTFTPRPFGLAASLSPVGPLDRCAPRALTATATTPAFGTGTGFNGAVKSVGAYLMAGKILVGGDFTSYNGTARNGVMQLNVDGSVDTNFSGTGFNTFAGNTVNSVLPTGNNKILVGGLFTTYNGSARVNLVRLYGDGWASPGLVDNTFNPGTGFNAVVRSLAMQANGQILVGGDFTRYNGGPATSGIVRLNSDATQDLTFAIGAGASNSVYTLAVQDDGKILVGGIFTTFGGATANGIARLNPDGSVDATFNTGTGFNAGGVYSIGVQADGKLLVGGNFTTYKGVAASRIIRLNADGSRDAAFTLGTGFDATVQSIIVQSDGKAVLGGSFTTYKGSTANRVIRLNTDGSADASFTPGTGANGAVASLALQNNNLILAGGSFTSYNGNAGQNRLVRLATNGSQNTTPTPVSGASFSMSNANGSNPFFPPRANTYQARATLTGITTSSNIVTVTDCVAPTITSFTPTSGETGTVVTLTGTTLGDVTGVSVNNTAAPFNIISATSLTFTVAAGTTTGLVRVTNAAGTATGGTFTVLNPTVSGISPSSGPAGTLVVVTGANLDRVRGVRFGTGGLGLFTAQTATSLTVRVPVDAATGVLTLTSVASNTTSSPTFTYAPRPAGLLASLSPLGTQDVCQPRTLTGSASSPAFATGTGFGGRVLAMVVQADGRILAGGNFTTYKGATQNRIARLLPDGAVDAAFASGTGFTGGVISVAVQADGKVLVGGSITAYNGTTGLTRLVRLNADGTRDVTFALGTGFDAVVRSVAVQPDGKVLVGGSFTSYNGTTQNNLIRLLPNGSRDASFVVGTGFDGQVAGLTLQPDGKVLVSGVFTTYNGTAGQINLIRLNADGSRDATFATGTGFDSDVVSVALQPDGKVLVGGFFTAYNGSTGQNRLIRLNADGSRDATFATGTGFDAPVRQLMLQPDGKMLVGGDFTAYNGSTGLNRLLRLNADGSRDATFATGTGFDNPVFAAALQADGRVLAGGDFLNFNGASATRLARLTATGALDTTPTPVSGATFTFTPGNSTANPLVTSTAGSYTAVASLNGETSLASNSITLTACPAPTITSFTPTSGGTGTVVTVTGTNLSFANAASVNGTAGTTLTNSTATSLTFTVAAGSTTGPVTVTTPGGTATGGTFTADPVTITSFSPTTGAAGTVVIITGTNLLGATAVNVNGVSQPGFTVNSSTQITFTVSATAATGPVSVTMPGGGTATGGTFSVTAPTFSSFSPVSGPAGTLVTITGTSLDQLKGVRFGGGGLGLFTAQTSTSLTVRVPMDAATGVLTLSALSGTLLTSAATFTYTPRPAGLVATLSTAGPLDACTPRTLTASAVSPAFATGTGLDANTNSIVAQTDGKVLIGGTFVNYNGATVNRIVRVNTDGTRDATFATGTGFDALVSAVAVQADGKVLVGGDFTTYNGTSATRLIRLNADGSRDATFVTGAGFGATVQTVVVQPDGQILVGGAFTTYNGAPENRLVRLHPDGSRDATFATGTGFNSIVYALAVQPDGKVLAGGVFTAYNGAASQNCLIRLNADGSRDASFATGTGFNSSVFSLVLQPDGKVLAGGFYASYNGTAGQNSLIRLNANGSRDAGFTTGTGFNSQVSSVAMQADGKVLVSGPFTTYNAATVNRIVRLNTDGTRDATFVTGTGFDAGVRRLAVQPDGRVVVGGNFTTYNGTAFTRLLRLNPDGTPNTAVTPVPGATFTFSPGNTTANPLVTSTAGSYSVVASLNGEASEASNTITLTACPLIDLVVNTAGQTIAPGTYNTVTITETGTGTLTGDINVTGTFWVQSGGRLDDNCFVISGAGNFVLAAGATLEICSANGITASGAQGTVQVDGSRTYSRAASYVYDSPTTGSGASTGNGLPDRVRDLTAATPAAPLFLTNPTSVRRLLTLSGAPLNTSGQALTLLSDADSTALVVNVAAGRVSGTVTVQRYITPGTAPGLGYRHMSAPVSNSTVADLTTTGFTPVVNAAYNTATTTASVRPYPTVFGFDETRFPASSDFTRGYFSPGSLDDALVPGKGYSVYMSGGLTPDFVGTLTTGDVTMNNLTHTGNFNTSEQKSGWHLLGNPFPAPLDWDLVTIPAGMSNSVSVFKSTGGANGVYLTRAGGTGSLTDGMLAMGQGFFVRNISTGPVNFTLPTSARLTSYDAPAHFRAAPDTRPLVHLTLHALGAPAEETDAATVYFQAGATAGLDAQFDGEKPGHNVGVPTLVTLSGTDELAVNGLPETALATGLTIPLLLDLPQAGTYELAVGNAVQLANAPLLLVDQLTGTRYAVADQPTVRFTAHQAGEIRNRFALVINGQRVTNTSDLSPKPLPQPRNHGRGSTPHRQRRPPGGDGARPDRPPRGHGPG